MLYRKHYRFDAWCVNLTAAINLAAVFSFVVPYRLLNGR